MTVKIIPMSLLLLAAWWAIVSTGAVAEEPGETLFKKNRAICHTLEEGKNKIGPSLAGVVGRKAGIVPGFAYSAANKNSGDTWDEVTLDTYLTDPRKFMPGTKMVFAGLKNSEDRKAHEPPDAGADEIAERLSHHPGAAPTVQRTVRLRP